FVIVKLEGVDTRDDAETLRGALLQVPGDQVVPLPEDHYYVFQIVGLEVVDEDGRELGVVKEVLFTGANDVYVVERADGSELLLPAVKDVEFTGANDVYVVERADGSELLLPAVKDVVLRVDVDAGR